MELKLHFNGIVGFDAMKPFLYCAVHLIGSRSQHSSIHKLFSFLFYSYLFHYFFFFLFPSHFSMYCFNIVLKSDEKKRSWRTTHSRDQNENIIKNIVYDEISDKRNSLASQPGITASPWRGYGRSSKVQQMLCRQHRFVYKRARAYTVRDIQRDYISWPWYEE